MQKYNNIAYYIDFSIQEIPSIAFIAYEIGGIVYTNYEMTYDFIKKDFPKLNPVYFPSIDKIKQDMVHRNIKIIIYPDYHIRFFKELAGVKHVQVFHGISDKIYDFRKDVLEYDLFFIPGEEAYKRYKKRGLLKTDKGVLTGFPKMDRVFKGELHRDKILINLGMNPRNKTVLYAPTWVDKAFNSSWKKFRDAFLRDKPESISLIVKLHPNLKRYRKQETENFKTKLTGLQNTRFFDLLPDIVPLYAASDALAGDVSSVTREYLAFKRPFLFLSNKPEWMWSKKKIALWECGDVVRNPKKLWVTVMKALNNPERYSQNIENQFKKTFYKPDGNAAKRAAAAIINIMK